VLRRIYDLQTLIAYQGRVWENEKLLQQMGQYERARWWRRMLKRLFPRRHPYPLRIDWIETDLGDIGVGYNKHQQTQSVVITAEGSDVPGLKPVDRYNQLVALGDSIRRMSIGEPLSISQIMRRRPPGEWEFNNAINKSHHPDVVVPPALVDELETGKSSDELYREGSISKESARQMRLNEIAIQESKKLAMAYGGEVDYAMVLTVPRDNRTRQAARGRRAKLLKDNEIRRMSLMRVVKFAQDACERFGVEGMQILDKTQLEEFCAFPWKEADAPEDDEIPFNHPAYGLYAAANASGADDTSFVAYRITETPLEVDMGLMTALFTQTGVPISVAFLGENKSATAKGSSLWFISGIIEAFDGWNLGARFSQYGERVSESSEALAQRRYVQHVNILAIVYGRDPDQLAEDCDRFEREAQTLGFQLETAPGPSLQLTCLFAGWTGMVAI
jgi:hypothetical protein